MLKKTEAFEKKLKSNMYQYTFDKNNPPVLMGSFKNVTYISDIDFSLFVRFNPTFIKILIYKIKNLKDFRFLYLNAGLDQRFRVPWVIHPDIESDFDPASDCCNFNLNKSLSWLESF